MCVNVYTKHQRCCGKCQYQNTSVCPEASLHAASTAAAASSPPPPPPATSPRATTGFLEVPVNWREHSEALPCAVFARAGGMVPTPSRAAAGLRRLHEPEMAVAAQTLVAPVFLPAALGPPAASVNSPCKKRRAVRPVDELCRQCKRDQKRRRLEAAAGSTNGEGKAAEMRGEVEKETESGDADDSGEGSSGRK